MTTGCKRPSAQRQPRRIVASIQRYTTVDDRRLAGRKHKDDSCDAAGLFGIVQDSATTPAERRQAALELGQYFLPRKPTLKRSQRGKLIRDQYGFEVDPNVARELRDTKLKLACLPLSKRKLTPYAMAQKASKLHARIKEI